MEKNYAQFQDLDIEQFRRLAESDAAKQLYALLQSGDSNQLQLAMQHAAAGNMAQAGDALQQMLTGDRAQALLKQLQGEANG